MKIMKTIPQEGDVYSHEAPTAKVLMGLTWFFLLVSTATVTASWEVFLRNSLAPLGGWKWPVVVIWGALFCLPVNILILELSKYFWRSIIKGYWRGAHLFQFVIATLLLLAGLSYSVYMSQKATRAAMVSAAPKEQTVNTEKLDLDYRQQMAAAAKAYNENAGATDDRYTALEKAVSKKYATLLDSLQGEYAISAAKKPGTKTTNRLNFLSRKIQAAESAKAAELSTLATAKAGEIADFQAAKSSAEKSAADLRETNLGILTKGTQTGNGDTAAFARTFSNLISIVAAVADLFVFLLACFVELFYHRTGVKRLVFAENSDITGGVVIEIIRYPFVAIARHLSVWVSKRYAALPEPIAPRAPEDLFDPSEFASKILSAAKSQPEAKAKAAKAELAKPYIPPNLVPVSYDRTRDALPPLTTSSAPFIQPQKSVDSFSLKDSTPLSDSAKDDAAKSAKGIPDELEDIIKAAFKSPVTDPANFYDRMEVWPGKYATAFDYLDKLKKTARNCHTAAKNPKGTAATKAANAVRFAYLDAELCRLSVGVVYADSGIKFRWILNQAERNNWRSKISGI